MNRPQRATRNNVAKAFVPGGVISSFTGVPQNQPAQPVLPVTAPTNNIQVNIQEPMNTVASAPAQINPTPANPASVNPVVANPVVANPLPMNQAPIKQELIQPAAKTDNTSDAQLMDTLIGLKRRFTRPPVPKKLKRLRRNRRLRKILTPKNALMSLHELLGTGLSDFTIMPEERGFVATVYVNNVQYEGHGISKMAAKNSASEKALRDIIIQRMVQSPKAMALKANVEGQAGGEDVFHEDVDMVDNENDNEDEDEVPMLHLASFALHKLFSEWQSEGFEIPDFKAGTTVVNAIESMAIDKPVKQPGIPAKRIQVPENANTMHPTTLLCMMRPTTKYVDLGSEGQVPNILHRVGVEIDGQHFIGSAKNKKLARKFAAIDACNQFFGTNFAKTEN